MLLDGTKSAFAEPLDLLHIEHIALTCSVDQLRHYFFESLKGTNRDLYVSNSDLYLEDERLKQRFREHAKFAFGSELYQ